MERGAVFLVLPDGGVKNLVLVFAGTEKEMGKMRMET